MTYNYFSHNGRIQPASQAAVPLDNIEYAYGFGVYETVRAAHGKALFLDEHCRRLMDSARIIGLEHPFSAGSVRQNVENLLAKLKVEACNIKILLIGAAAKENANLYIQCLNPLFPDRKLYKNGADVTTARFERAYPHAKTLNMLPSYLAYRGARQAGAYDALLINSKGCITEGTRTNFFGLKDQTLYSAPEEEILLGVTRDHVIQVARKAGFKLELTDILLDNVKQFDSVFLTSTSSKIMPLKSIDKATWDSPVSAELAKLMRAFDDFLDTVG
jgi:branched-subunit amino acid aminotransferase/4-amino-4-deoxychorismate lyase